MNLSPARSLLIVGFLAAVTSAPAALLVYEGFDVPGSTVGPSPNVGATSFGWATGSGWNSTTSATTGLSYGSLQTVGSSNIIDGWGQDRTLAVDLTGDIWISFLANPNVDTDALAVITLRDSGFNADDRIFGFNSGANPVNGAWNDVGTAGAGANLVVVNFNTTTGLSKFYLNPTNASLGGATPDATALLDTRTLTPDDIRNIQLGTGTGNYIDEIRIGQSWADVTPVPEPTVVTLLATVGLTMVISLRKRRIAA